LYCQDLKIKTFVGTSRYHGDLAPYSFLNATSDAHFSIGASVGFQLTDFYSINLKYLSGKLSGNDALSANPKRRSRNLRFESPLNEIGLISELNLNNLFWNGKSKYGVHLILSTGLNLFHFNPRTDYRGSIYFLQPLGTEGQGLQGGPEELYDLSQWNIPYGISIEFKVGKHLNMGIEVSSRHTFTDYIDDVSGVYPDYDLLVEERGEIALALSNRMGELAGGAINESGSSRGNPENNDWFLVTGVYLCYYFGSNPINLKEKEEEKIDSTGSALIFPKN
jgi:hypothetical protein